MTTVRSYGRKFLTVLYLLCIAFILPNASGCSPSKTEYTLFSDADKTVSFVGGTIKEAIGIVLDEHELLICNYKGKTVCGQSFSERITFFEMTEYSILVGFETNRIELYELEGNVLSAKSQYSFETDIAEAEFVDDSDTIVLLDSGELWKCSFQSDGIQLIDANVKCVSYDACYHVVVYITEQGEIRGLSSYLPEYVSNIDQSILKDIDSITDSYYESELCFLARGKENSYYISINIDHVFSLIEMESNENFEPVYTAKIVPETALYMENNQLYYEGMSIDNKKEYRKRNKKVHGRVSLDIPNEYKVCVALGCVIYFSQHEVNIQLIK
ncbi:MAG: hypothetical protein J5752_11640 [Clostridiales bacterium]|nr:hypothetical protein [Clostridiales bacterium]